MGKPRRYLSRPQVAERLGITRGTIGRYRLPEPDAFIGTLPGWMVETIDAWNAARPSRRMSDGGDRSHPHRGSAE